MGIFGREKKERRREQLEAKLDCENLLHTRRPHKQCGDTLWSLHCPSAGWNLFPGVELQGPRWGLENVSLSRVRRGGINWMNSHFG